MIEFKNIINKQAKSYEIACKCARTSNIYAQSVLEANRFNLNFLYHLRSLELDACKMLILQSIFRAEDIEPCSINIVATNRADMLKIIVNADLDSALEASECECYYKRTFKNAKGEYTFIYEVKFDLTL